MEQLSFYFAVIILVGISVCYYFYYRKENGMSNSSSSLPILSKYSRDLTEMARQKKLDIVVGREEEIGRVIQILCRRNKNNPVLIGRAGIGKTAIVEGLALAIVKKEVSPSLYGKRVLALDLPGILAGTKFRGEFEQRLKKVIEEISKAQRMIILFIDEIHILAEAGEAEGAINAADILKPMLARGELQVVGATTNEEYEEFIKKDKTLDRRLQPVFVSEPTRAQTEKILNGIKETYEKYHQVKITAGAIKAAISATESIKNRAYPDKAIDAIDEASSKVHLRQVAKKGSSSAKPELKAEDIKAVVKEWGRNQ